MMTAALLPPAPFRVRESFALIGLYWLGIPIALALLLRLVTLVVPGTHDLVSLFQPGSDTSRILVMGCQVALTLSIIELWLRKRGRHWRDIGLRRAPLVASLKHLALFPLLAVAALVAVVLIAGVIFVVLQLTLGIEIGNPGSEGATRDFAALYGSGPVMVLRNIILAPIIEEVLFRGILLSALLQRVSARWAIALSSIAFGIVHVDPLAIPITILLGVYLSFMYRRLGSILPGIIAHAAYNAAIIAINLGMQAN